MQTCKLVLLCISARVGLEVRVFRSVKAESSRRIKSERRMNINSVKQTHTHKKSDRLKTNNTSYIRDRQ